MGAPSFPADAYGNAMPVLPVKYGSSVEAALPTATAVAIGDGSGAMVRVWALSCDMYYHFGASGLAAPTATAALILTNGYFDVPLAVGQTHFRAIAKNGSGSYRLEILGA